jgi:hypothetical protein
MNTGAARLKTFARFTSVGIAAAVFGVVAYTQTPARAGAAQAPARGAAVPAAARTTAAGIKPEATLLQVMRGILFPSSNVIFAAQNDISKLPPAEDPSTSPNPLTNSYGGWEAVQNAALALSESANLLVIPGRLCSNGRPAPVARADWTKYVNGLREAGRAAYKAAQKKDQDAMVDASGTVADACSACHDVYREKKTGPKDRCLP